MIVDLVWAHQHRLVVPGGKEAHLSIADTVPSGSKVKGSVNWAPVLVNVLVIAAMVLTRGESVQAATTLKQLAVGEEDAVWQAQAEVRLLISDAAEKTGWDSETARAIRASNMTLTGAYVTLGWDLLDAGVCGANALARTGDEVTGKSEGTQALGQAWHLLVNQCLKPFLEKVLPVLGRIVEGFTAVDAHELVHGLIESVKDLSQVSGALTALGVKVATLGKVDLTHAWLRLEKVQTTVDVRAAVIRALVRVFGGVSRTPPADPQQYYLVGYDEQSLTIGQGALRERVPVVCPGQPEQRVGFIGVCTFVPGWCRCKAQMSACACFRAPRRPCRPYS